MKHSLIALCALALAGCASIENAGHASYEVKANAQGGCDLLAKDGKEFSGEGRGIMFDGKRCQFTANEGPSKAFKGQAISAKAATVGIADLANVVNGDK